LKYSCIISCPHPNFLLLISMLLLLLNVITLIYIILENSLTFEKETTLIIGKTNGFISSTFAKVRLSSVHNAKPTISLKILKSHQKSNVQRPHHHHHLHIIMIIIIINHHYYHHHHCHHLHHILLHHHHHRHHHHQFMLVAHHSKVTKQNPRIRHVTLIHNPRFNRCWGTNSEGFRLSRSGLVLGECFKTWGTPKSSEEWRLFGFRFGNIHPRFILLYFY
jgi:hypothetical protein